MAKKIEHKTYDELPGGRLKKGDHVRQFMSKLKQRYTGPVGMIVDFVNVKMRARGVVWRAFVHWQPEGEEAYEQYVDAELLDKTDAPLPVPPLPEPEPDPELDGLFTKKCADCGGDLEFDPDLVGDTVGGLTLRGWMVCKQCSKAWLAPKGMAVVYEGSWKLASGGRSVETGNGRIRVDGCSDVEALMARIVKLPDLELEVAYLRKNQRTNADVFREIDVKIADRPPDEFRKLQNQVYDSLQTYRRREEWDGKDIEQARACLRQAEYEVDTHEMTCAIQYAIKYGRMP